MSEAYRTSGTGSYRHDRSDGWGVHSVQLHGDDVLVRTEFVRGGTMISRGYRWVPERKPPSGAG